MAVLTNQSPYTTNLTHQQKNHFVAIPGTFHLYKTGHGNMHILDTDDQTRLYDIKTHSFSSSPDISLYRLAAVTSAAPAFAPAPAAVAAAAGLNANANNLILCGSAKFHDLSSTIDLQIGLQPVIPFKAPGMLSTSRTFQSCVLGELKWKHDMRLLNTREEVVATFTHAKEKLSFHLTHKNKPPKKLGWFEMAPAVAGGGQRLVDEIVLSGVALFEFDRRVKKYEDMGEAAGGVGEGVGAAAGG